MVPMMYEWIIAERFEALEAKVEALEERLKAIEADASHAETFGVWPATHKSARQKLKTKA